MRQEGQRFILEVNGFDGSRRFPVRTRRRRESMSACYAIILVDGQGASIIDSGYRSGAEAKAVWPEAKEPSGKHLTPSAADERAIAGTLGSSKLSE